MFEDTTTPRVFACPPGVDFAATLLAGLTDRMTTASPIDWARVEIFVNTRRTERRLAALFSGGPARLLPRIRLITDLADDPALFDAPPAISSLQRRLEVVKLVRQLIARFEDLAPTAAVFELATSLSALMEEMQIEGVDPAVFSTLDVSDVSGHWQRALQFILIAQNFVDDPDQPDTAARLRLAVMAQIAKWQITPPSHPIILAGSTGSRGTTFDLMKAVSHLPQGALILPGFDFDVDQSIWDRLADTSKDIGEDHPQFRFAKLLNELGQTANQVEDWSPNCGTKSPRNALISLAMRPAPVTHHWRKEGPDLKNLDDATSGITWLEAPDQRIEALAIALRLRQAAHDGQTAAVITPDRNLTRRIATALSRWDIIPDDSAGVPLLQSAPGRFLLHLLDFSAGPLNAETLLVLLKHPLTHSGSGRQDHLRMTRDLELYLRRAGPAFLTPDALQKWAVDRDYRLPWVKWVNQFAFSKWPDQPNDVIGYLTHHLDLADLVSDGPGGEKGELWKEAAGRKTAEVLDDLRTCADAAGPVDLIEYRSILSGVLNAGEVRAQNNPHPNILIWGALEARVQSADVVILAGLNEGSWPEAPSPDPWLNRNLRKQAGLLLPDRNIGLSAHDFQQAIGSDHVWITRSLRSDDAETVPSRWLNRLQNLLQGLGDDPNQDWCAHMKSRGAYWLNLVEKQGQVADPTDAPRPSVAPPVAARPDRLSVTEIKTLVRDPYAIYAKHVLGLRKLNPLVQTADAPLRGTVIHEVMAEFSQLGPISDAIDGKQRLMQLAQEMLLDLVPWPAARRSWLARIARFADWFIAGELKRQSGRQNVEVEIKGEVQIPSLGFTLRGTADRIDIAVDGTAWVYDYKTGKPPTKPQQTYFDKQLLLEVEMLRHGAFEKLGHPHVTGAEYIGLGAKPEIVAAPMDEVDVWAEFCNLIASYQSEDRGYTARRAMVTSDAMSDFDHLSRLGEWGTDQPAKTVKVK